MKTEEAKRHQKMEVENARLKRLLAAAEPGQGDALKELASGNV